MKSILGLLTLAGFLVGATSAGQQATTVQFSEIGQVFIRTARPTGGFPTILFTDAQRKVLLSVELGADDPLLFRITPEEGPGGMEDPILRYAMVNGPKPGSKAVLAVSMYTGGSDCEYKATVVGPQHGQLQSWLDKQVVTTNAEGGMYLGDLGKGRGYGFAVWNFLWESDGHSSPHRYSLDLYRFDPNDGKLKLIAKMETKRTYGRDTEALAEFGLRYPNLLRSFADFRC
jgi:hypothetical protein